MKRTRVLLLGILSVVVMMSLIAGATVALFTADAANEDNTFTAGTLSISQADKTTWDIKVGNMAPGDSFEKLITVTNTGTLALEFASTNSRVGALFAGPHRAFVELFDGYGDLAPGQSQDVRVRVTLPREANNTYQGATGTVTVTFHAFQTKNLTPAAAATVQTNNNAAGPGGNLYDGYLFQDGSGNTIPLTTGNILAIYEIRPDLTVNYLAPLDNTDPKLWFNNAKPNGTYQYVVVTLTGTRYTTSLTHVGD